MCGKGAGTASSPLFLKDRGRGRSGTNRITQVSNIVVAASPNRLRTHTYVWDTGQSTGTLVSRSERSTDGLQSWQSQFIDPSTPVTSHSTTAYHSSGARAQTNAAPDGSYTASLYSYGRLQSVTRFDSLGYQLFSIFYSYDAHGRQNVATDARNGATTNTFNPADGIASTTTPSPGLGQPPLNTKTFYDSSLRAFAVTQPDGTSVTNEFFPTGLLKKTYGSRTYPVAYTYDYAGRMKTMTTWQNYASSSGAATTT